MLKQITGQKRLLQLAQQAHLKGKRLIAPLMGFPGCDMLGVSIKTAQQNHAIHHKCIRTLTDKFKPDMAFMMMDLSVEANALGLTVRFPANESSSVEEHPVKTIDDLAAYKNISVLSDARIQSYLKTIEMMKFSLPSDIMIGAYVIGPVTLAGLLQGAQQVAIDSITETEKLEQLCEFATSVIIEYANALISAGADAICILEPTGVILGPVQFERFSGKYVQQIMESYRARNIDTIYHICGNTMHIVNLMANSGVAAISIDSSGAGVDIEKVMQIIPSNVVVIGNINPTSVMKDATPLQVGEKVTELLEKIRDYPNFILSTGCDLPPGTPPENIAAFMQTGRDFTGKTPIFNAKTHSIAI